MRGRGSPQPMHGPSMPCCMAACACCAFRRHWKIGSKPRRRANACKPCWAQAPLVSVLFNWLLLSDWMMIPDRFDAALRLRLMWFTPCILLGLVVLTKLKSPVLRESALVLAGMASTAINVHLCIHSTDPMAGPYLISVSVVLVYCNTVARMHLRPALCLDFFVMAMFLYGWACLPTAPFAIMAPAGLTVLSLAVFTLYGAYMQERDVRQNWLLLMRERLLQHELLQANASLEEASRNDQLTELASRRHFDAQLEHLWQQASSKGQEVSLILLAVDHFKACQANHGQGTADDCLRAIAGVIRADFQHPWRPAGAFRRRGVRRADGGDPAADRRGRGRAHPQGGGKPAPSAWPRRARSHHPQPGRLVHAA